MKKLVLSCLIFFTALAVRAGGFETHYGIGVVNIKPYNFFSISFWKMPKDKVPYDELYFQRDSGNSKLRCGFSTTGIDSVPAWFAPELFSFTEERMRIAMRCIRKEENWCQVVVNNATGELKWIELGTDIVFSDWSAFYQSMATVEIVSGSPQLFEKPSAKSKFILIKTKQEAGAKQMIRAKKIQGIWMYVEVTEFDAEHKETGRKSGWIRWRDSEKPLIIYNILSC